MIDTIHLWVVNFADKYTIYILYLAILFGLLPGIAVLKFRFPDKKGNLSFEIRKLVIKLFWRSIPSGMLFGMIFLVSSDSNSDLLMLPICGVGFSILMVIFTPIKILRMGQRHYKNK